MHHETLFKSFNNKNTTTEKRDKEHKYQKGKRKLEIILVIKWKTIKNTKKKGENKSN